MVLVSGLIWANRDITGSLYSCPGAATRKLIDPHVILAIDSPRKYPSYSKDITKIQSLVSVQLVAF